jgi:hypothetical protein
MPSNIVPSVARVLLLMILLTVVSKASASAQAYRIDDLVTLFESGVAPGR